MSQNMELKAQALLERISSLTMQYENQIADLRVELTRVSEELNSLRSQSQAPSEDREPIEGIVVEE